jgi:hypothetical protein
VEPGQSVLRTYSSPTGASFSTHPAEGYVFDRWIGAGCAHQMTISTDMMCVIDFAPAP